MHIRTKVLGLVNIFVSVLLTAACSEITTKEGAVRYYQKNKKELREAALKILAHPNIRVINPRYDPNSDRDRFIEPRLAGLQEEDRKIYAEMLPVMAALDIDLINAGTDDRGTLVDFIISSWGILDNSESISVAFIPRGDINVRMGSSSSCVAAGDPAWFACHSQ